MNDALWLAGYLLLAFIGLGWLVSRAAEWLIERIKHD